MRCKIIRVCPNHAPLGIFWSFFALMLLELMRILKVLPAPNSLSGGGFRAANTRTAFGGGWTQRKGQLQWKTQLPVSGHYRGWVELACPEASAGNASEVSAAGQSLKGIFPQTGGWEQFKPHFPAVLDLCHTRTGDLTITLTSTSQSGEAVMNFRALHLNAEFAL